MEKPFAEPGSRAGKNEDVASDLPAAEVVRRREESRLTDGMAMESDSTTIMNHNVTGNGSGESGSQGNTLGRENQNPITDGKGGAASPDQSRGDSIGGGTNGER